MVVAVMQGLHQLAGKEGSMACRRLGLGKVELEQGVMREF